MAAIVDLCSKGCWVYMHKRFTDIDSGGGVCPHIRKRTQGHRDLVGSYEKDDGILQISCIHECVSFGIQQCSMKTTTTTVYDRK